MVVNKKNRSHKKTYEYLVNSADALFATRLIFLIAGFAMASWAPLVPFIKNNLSIDEKELGFLLISLATGSLSMMPIAAILIEKIGCRLTIVLGVIFVVFSLPILVLVHSYYAVGLLFFFGAGLGLIDISMNTQAIFIEKKALKPIMSSMHAFWSVGGIFGPLIVTGIYHLFEELWLVTLTVAIIVLVSFLFILNGLLPKPNSVNSDSNNEKVPLFVLPRGVVLIIGILCFILFLMEGAILDWSALFMQEYSGVSVEYAGIGFTIFSIAMTIGRLTGDKIISLIGSFKVLFLGGILCILGFTMLVFFPYAIVSLLSFFFIGLGAANSVPILFSAAGNQSFMPPRLAVASVAMIGYGGMLFGPALIGFIAHQVGLDRVFLLIAFLLLVVLGFSRRITSSTSE